MQELACFSSPSRVAHAFAEFWGFEVSPQACEKYDPTKVAGARLSKKYRIIFEAARKAFLEHVENHVPHANKAVRIRKLAQAADEFEERGNYIAMAEILAQIAKETGGAFTNRREHTGRDGGPIQTEDVTEIPDAELDLAIENLLKRRGVSVTDAA